jgi:hypothetical protein
VIAASALQLPDDHSLAALLSSARAQFRGIVEPPG